MTDPMANQGNSLQVPSDFPLTLNVNMAEAKMIGGLLEELPHKNVAALLMRLNAQVAQQAHAAFNPPKTMLLDGEGSVKTVPQEELWGNQPKAAGLLAAAESQRRETAGRLFTSQLREETPNEDYATALLYVQQGLQHLDESVPNGQLERTLDAFAAMKHGVAMFEAWLNRRDYGIKP